MDVQGLHKQYLDSLIFIFNVPNLSGTKDWFHERQFFHGPGAGGDGFGMIQAHYIPAHLLLCGLCLTARRLGTPVVQPAFCFTSFRSPADALQWSKFLTEWSHLGAVLSILGLRRELYVYFILSSTINKVFSVEYCFEHPCKEAKSIYCLWRIWCRDPWGSKYRW